MSKTLRNTDAVFHAWNNLVYESAKFGNVSYSGNRLYSYAACIAAILPTGAVAHSTRSWSPTTHSHQSSARSASSNRTAVYCYNPEYSVVENMRIAREIVAHLLAPVAPLYKKDGKTETVNSIKARSKKRAEALRVAEQANNYLRHSGNTTEPAIDTSNLDDIRKELEEREEAKRKEREEHQKQLAAQATETLAGWRKYEVHPIFQGRLHNLPPALRLSKDGSVVETSHGAEIPSDAALQLWPWVKRAKKLGQEITPQGGIRLGHYTLSMIRADGTIVVGCHTIAFEEIEGIAKSLKLLEN